MGKKIWFSGTTIEDPPPGMAPLRALIGSVCDYFCWAGSVELEDGRHLAAFRHRRTHVVLYLDAEGGAYDRDFGNRPRYQEVDLRSALDRAFDWWWDRHNSDRPDTGGLSPRQEALISAAIRYAGRPSTPSGWTAQYGPLATAVNVDQDLLARARAYVPESERHNDDAVVNHALALYAIDRDLNDPEWNACSSLTDRDEQLLHREDVHRALHPHTDRPWSGVPF